MTIKGDTGGGGRRLDDTIVSAFTDACAQAMQVLAHDPRVMFLGQNVCYPGHVVYDSMQGIPDNCKIELPVAEAMQMGISTGLALAGFVPVTIYPRIDFLLLAIDQLVNHLDKLEKMSQGQFKPKVIIRTMLGATYPLDPGPQHSGDYIEAFEAMLTNVAVITTCWPYDVVSAYKVALQRHQSTIVIEIDRGKRLEYRQD